MPRILYFHGLGGSPRGPKVSAMRSKFGQEGVLAAEFPFSSEALNRRARTVSFEGFKRIGAEIMGMGAESERIAREAYDAHHPDILVGSSLGGALAMHLAADKHLPSVLLAPVWITQIKGDYLQQFLVRRMPNLQYHEHLMPLFDTFLPRWVENFAGFAISDQVQPRTLILHSPNDKLIDLKQSVKLLTNSPLPEGDADTAFMNSVTDTLVRRGYETDGRLVKVGDDHKMNDPDALRALVDAVCLLSSEYNETNL